MGALSWDYDKPGAHGQVYQVLISLSWGFNNVHNELAHKLEINELALGSILKYWINSALIGTALSGHVSEVVQLGGGVC